MLMHATNILVTLSLLGRRATDVVGSPLSGKLAVTDESDADSSLRRISRADGDRPPAWQPPPSFDAASPIQPYGGSSHVSSSPV